MDAIGPMFGIMPVLMGTDEVRDKAFREKLYRQFEENVLQRLNDKSSGSIVLVMQRLHEDDLTAHLIAKNEGWVHVDLSAIALKDEKWPITDTKFYHRKKGEVLHPNRESKEALLNVLHSINSHAFSYQYLQGHYQPRFGEEEKRCVWFSPLRDDEFYDLEVAKEERRNGFYFVHEKELIKSQVFGIGEDIIPDNMRHGYTLEELEFHGNILREKMLERERMREAEDLLI